MTRPFYSVGIFLSILMSSSLGIARADEKMTPPTPPVAANPSGAHGEHGMHDEHGTQGKAVALTGEIIDLTCYLAHPETGRGAEHQQCAESCLNKGLPAGLLVDKTLYVLLGPNHQAVNDKVAEYAGKVVTINGVVKEMNGLKGIIVESVKP